MRLRRFRLTPRTYVIASAAAILLPALFLSLLGLYLVRSQLHFQQRILEEYSLYSTEYAATELMRTITDQEREIASYLLLAVLPPGVDVQKELWRLEVSYPLVRGAFLLCDDGTPIFARYDSAAALARAPDLARVTGILEEMLNADTRAHVRLSGEVHFYAGEHAGEPYQFAALPLRDSQGLCLGVGGFFLNQDYVRGSLVEKTLETTIHAAEGRFAPDFGKVLTLVVLDESGDLVYAHHHAGNGKEPAKTTRFLARSDLGDVLTGWTIGLTYAKASGFASMRRLFSLHVTLLVFALGLVVLGTAFTMRFALRQMELVRLKSHFVSNITHELKTPLAAIRLYTETLQQGRFHDRTEGDRFLGIIHKECVRLTQLINNVLDFARIEDGRRRYAFAPAAVGEVVREIVEAYAFQLRDKGFEVELDIAPELPEAMVDRDALGQAVLNLLDNAVKYSNDDRRIEVRVAVDGGDLRISVLDRGVGIAETEQDKIFAAFYRVEKGLEHSVKGSGLGLAVVKHIAEAHGGHIEVTSRPGAGSEFTLWIPAQQAPAASEVLEDERAHTGRSA